MNTILTEQKKDKVQDSWKTTLPVITKTERKWFFINLKNKNAGRTAVLISNILRGKNKNTFFHNFDLGDNVVLVNAKLIKFTGKNKLTDKFYYNHSQYIGNLRKRNTKEMIQKYPKELIFRIVKGMMPQTKLSRKQLKRLFIFENEKHSLIAQEKKFEYLK